MRSMVEGASFPLVIAGLDPAIHVEPHFSMDHRVKPGGDETRMSDFMLALLKPLCSSPLQKGIRAHLALFSAMHRGQTRPMWNWRLQADCSAARG
jgi:hypothetical protein